MTKGLVRALFIVAALYDGVLGVVFLLAPGYAFELFSVPPPNHMGYVQFPALLLLVFAVLFAQIAWRPDRFAHLILYGILLKVSYCGIVFWYWATTGIPHMWKPFAVIDVIFAALFVWAWLGLRERGSGG
jgi:hypothetical protein